MQQGSSAKRPPELKICVELTANVCRTIPQIVLGWPAGFQGYSDDCPGWFMERVVAPRPMTYWDLHPPRASFWPTSNETSTSPSSQSFFLLYVQRNITIFILPELCFAPCPLKYQHFHPPKIVVKQGKGPLSAVLTAGPWHEHAWCRVRDHAAGTVGTEELTFCWLYI